MQLRPRTKAAIAAVRAEGIHVVIVTGRMFQSVRRYALEAGIDVELVESVKQHGIISPLTLAPGTASGLATTVLTKYGAADFGTIASALDPASSATADSRRIDWVLSSRRGRWRGRRCACSGR